tara:strand:- start:695 stop:1831 length:1137 start_codon:yes stop_codon:yes gene_type:complete
MKNQKICIIGSGLAALTAAATLRKLNLKIDLFCTKHNTNYKKDKRTTSISDSNYHFIKENINLKKKNYFWPSRNINLFYESNEKLLNFLNYNSNDKNLMYVFENIKFVKHLINELKKSNNVNFLHHSVKEVNHDNSFVRFNNKKIYYDLIILCVGNESNLYKNLDLGRSINKDYKELAITGNVHHNLKINSSSQYFLKEGPLAILPFKKNMFSLVWSISNDFFKQDIKIIIKNKLRQIFGKKAKIKILELQFFPLYLNLKTKYFRKNVLILGQGIHRIHPIAGQGFNLILRDIKKLSEIIKKNSYLGLTIKDSYVLKEFYQSRQPENTIIGIGNDLVHNFFKKDKITDPIKINLLNKIGKYELVKKITRTISDRGFFL